MSLEKITAALAKLLLWAYFESCMEDALAPDLKLAVVGSFIQFNHQILSTFVIPEGVNSIERVGLIPSESGGLVTFAELVEPNFGDESHCDDGAGGPAIGPDGGVIPQRE